MKIRFGMAFHFTMLGCYVGAHNYYPIAQAVGFWGAQAAPFFVLGYIGVMQSVMTIALIRQAKSQIIRVFLLSGQTIARIYFRDGSKVDANINAIKQNKMENGNLHM